MPCSCDQAASRAADSRTWPTEPAGPSRPSAVSVWTESTTSRPGDRSAAAEDGVELRLGQHLDAVPATPVGEPQPVGAQVQLVRRLLARGVQDVGAAVRAAGRPAAAHGRRRRRSPAPASTCRYPARRPAAPGRPGTSPPPRTRSTSPMPTLSRARAEPPTSRSGRGGRLSRRRTAAPMARRGRDVAERPSRPASPTCRRRGSGPPRRRMTHRRTDRRSGSPAAPPR